MSSPFDADYDIFEGVDIEYAEYDADEEYQRAKDMELEG